MRAGKFRELKFRFGELQPNDGVQPGRARFSNQTALVGMSLTLDFGKQDASKGIAICPCNPGLATPRLSACAVSRSRPSCSFFRFDLRVGRAGSEGEQKVRGL